jgi:hypothetical protein
MICPSCQSVAITVVDLDPKSKAKCAHPVPTRGAYRDRHGRWVRDAVDVTVSLTNGTEADGEVVWS